MFSGSSIGFDKVVLLLSVWANTTAKNVKKLQLVQNLTARVISNT